MPPFRPRLHKRAPKGGGIRRQRRFEGDGFIAAAAGLGAARGVGMLREVLVPRGGRAAFPRAVEVARLALIGRSAQLLQTLRSLAHEVPARTRVEIALQRDRKSVV